MGNVLKVPCGLPRDKTHRRKNPLYLDAGGRGDAL